MDILRIYPLMAAALLVVFPNESHSERTIFLDSLGTCDAKWRETYRHDTAGESLDTQYTRRELQRRVMAGDMVKVTIEEQNSQSTFPLDDINFRDSHICGTQAWSMSHNFSHIDTHPDATPLTVCTDGSISNLRYSLMTWQRDVTREFPTVSGVTWYTKPVTCANKDAAVYSQFVDGSSAGGSHVKLEQFAKWAAVRIGMRDRGYFTSLQNTKIYDLGLVSAQSLEHHGLTYHQEGLVYSVTPAYTWAATWLSDGRRDLTKTFITNSSMYRHGDHHIAVDWFGDECLRRVYTIDEYGEEIQGSLQELITMVKLGHRLRVHFDGMTLQANGIRVIGDLVVAQTIEEIGRQDDKAKTIDEAPYFVDRSQRVYRLIHSHGLVKTYRFNEDDFSPVGGMDISNPEIAWMVDTRPWTKVYATDTTGLPIFGDTTFDLEEAVYVGASVRLNIEQDKTSGLFFTEADSVHYDLENNMIHAQCLKHVSDEKEQDKDEYSIQTRPFQWSLMVSSEGVVSMNARYLQSRGHFYEAEARSINVTWFVNL